MISNQILQNILDGLKEISKAELCVMDTDGKPLASTFSDFSTQPENIQSFVDSPEDSRLIENDYCFKVYDDNQTEYVLSIHNDSENARMIGELAAFQIQNLIETHKEYAVKDNFIKDLLLGNLLTVDLYRRATKLHMAKDVPRVVLVLKAQNIDVSHCAGQIEPLFRSRDFIAAMDEQSIAIVKELSSKENNKDIERLAHSLLTVPELRRGKEIRLAYGTIVHELKEVSRSYKEALLALDAGKIFFENKSVIAYTSLGVGRLIYQLPSSLCSVFIQEIFRNQPPDDIDKEIFDTIDAFFENNLNMSQTAKQLYIHRNTLVYRLDKLQKITGLDLRTFEDAVTLKIALMVVRYMKYKEKQI